LKSCDDIRKRLSLYLDGELQGEERVMVEGHLAECDSCGATLARELNFLSAVRESGPLYLAPTALRAKIEEVLKDENENPALVAVKSQRFRLNWMIAAAAVVLLLLVPVLIWRVTKQTEADGQLSSFALMAAETHLRRTRGQLPLEVQTASPQNISSWFVNKVDFSVQLPNYQESSGQEQLYTLEGARLVGFEKNYAAYVAYRMKERPISLVITSDSAARPSGGEEIQAKGLKFHYNAIDGLKVITWSDRGLTYALVSDLEERGQQSCIVCHEGTKDQELFAPLKPR
jgi:anti-sigma factor RsiW